MRQLAWLNAVPRPPARSKRAEKQLDTPQLSRIEKLKQQKLPVLMPPNPAPHIIGWLLEMGITQAAGMGAAPLSWTEIDAWARRTFIDIGPWEGRLLRRLSVEYLGESRRAEDETCPPIWRAPVTKVEVDTEQARLEELLG